MSGPMRALLGLELAYATHNIAAVLRSPWRLIAWSAYLLFLGFGLFTRFFSRSFAPGIPHGHGPHGGMGALAPAVTGMLVLSLGATTVSAALGRVATFRSRAEALLFSNGGISPLQTAVWLQVRRIASTFGRRLLTMVLYFVVFVPAQFGNSVQTGFALAGLLAALAALLGLELPVYLLARRTRALPLLLAGGVIALYGAAYGLAAFIAASLRAPLAIALLRRAPLDIGAFGSAVASGNLLALAALAALPLALIAAAVALGRDAIPELYEAAENGLALRERALRRGGSSRAAGAGTVVAPLTRRSARHVPPGARAIVWKDWLGAKRARGAAGAWLAGTLGAVLGVFGLAEAVREAGGPAFGAPLFGGALALILIAPVGAARGLSADFGKPLWWLGASTLRARMHALVFARAWRGSIVLTLALLAAALPFGRVDLALVAPIAAFALWWSLGALGTALYALFPIDLDRRGPLALVRMLSVAAYFAPVGIIGGLLTFAGLPLPLGVLVCAMLLGAEGAAAVEIAALKIVENGAVLASLERVT